MKNKINDEKLKKVNGGTVQNVPPDIIGNTNNKITIPNAGIGGGDKTGNGNNDEPDSNNQSGII